MISGKMETKDGFAASSISSFWMLREVYDYRYGDGYMPPANARRNWTGRNKHRHLFSVLQLGMGYETPLSKKLYFQVEPFVQVPLGQIGFGKVDLTSFGTHFTLKYQLK